MTRMISHRTLTNRYSVTFIFFGNFRGMYVCRTLSYKGVEFEVVEAPLEDDMMVMYANF